MATGETFKATVIGQLDDLSAVVFDFGYVDLVGGAVHIDTGTAAGSFQTLVQATMAAALPEDFTFKRYRFACVTGAHAGELGYVEVSPAVAGGLAAPNRYPNELAASLKRNTGHSSRRDRGRVFFGPLAVGVHDNSDVNKVDVDGPLAAVADLLKSPLTVGSLGVLQPVILAANGTYSGRIVINTSVAEVIVHRKTRRPRVGS